MEYYTLLEHTFQFLGYRFCVCRENLHPTNHGCMLIGIGFQYRLFKTQYASTIIPLPTAENIYIKEKDFGYLRRKNIYGIIKISHGNFAAIFIGSQKAWCMSERSEFARKACE